MLEARSSIWSGARPRNVFSAVTDQRKGCAEDPFAEAGRSTRAVAEAAPAAEGKAIRASTLTRGWNPALEPKSLEHDNETVWAPAESRSAASEDPDRGMECEVGGVPERRRQLMCSRLASRVRIRRRRPKATSSRHRT